MIFLTLGTQEPFDRLVKAVDDWCAETGRGADLFGQITERAGYTPKHFDWVASLPPDLHRERCSEAEFIISHAGMGSIITAMTYGKPIIVLPRRADLKEHRNDHQQATARRLGGRPGLMVAQTEHELPLLLGRLIAGETENEAAALSPFADQSLLDALAAFIHDKDR